MNILAILIPASVLLGLVGLAAFLWLLRHDQFEDLEGQAARVLSDRYDDAPAEDRAAAPGEKRPARNAAEKPAQSA